MPNTVWGNYRMEGNINNLLRQVIETGEGEPFYCLETSAHKTWLLPERNIRTAMAFYQPASLNGRAIKMVLPYYPYIPFSSHMGFINDMRITVNPVLINLLGEQFGCISPELSFFCGTPSKHQKITIQVSQEKNILGYCKLTDNPETAKIFSSEEGVLKELGDKGVDCVSRCLYNGKLFDSVFAFVQDTDRTGESKVSYRFSDCHMAFLRKLYAATNRSVAFSETDFAASIEYLGKCTDGFLPQDRSLLDEAVNIIKDYYREETVFSMYHGDFTPWNTFITGDKLSVFDFEYACRSSPPYMDACHFISETARLKLKLNSAEALDFFYRSIESLLQEIKSPEYFFLGYLLYTLSFYYRLYDGHFDTKDKGYAYWVELIRMLLNKTGSKETR